MDSIIFRRNTRKGGRYMQGGDMASLQKLQKDLKIQEKGKSDDDKQIIRLSEYIANSKKPKILGPGMDPKNLSIYKLTPAVVSRTTQELKDVEARKTKREAVIEGLKKQIANEQKFIEEVAKQKQAKANANSEKAARMKKIENNSRIRAVAKEQANFNKSVNNAAQATKKEANDKAKTSKLPATHRVNNGTKPVPVPIIRSALTPAIATVGVVNKGSTQPVPVLQKMPNSRQNIKELLEAAEKVSKDLQAAARDVRLTMNITTTPAAGGNRRTRRR